MVFKSLLLYVVCLACSRPKNTVQMPAVATVQIDDGKTAQTIHAKDSWLCIVYKAGDHIHNKRYKKLGKENDQRQ